MSARWVRAAFQTLCTIAIAAGIMIGCGGGEPSADESGSAETDATTTTTGAPAASDAAVFPPIDNPEQLSDWRQLEVGDSQLLLGADTVPYTLNSALFSDYAHKLRTVWLPDGGEPAVYDTDAVFDFPVGTVITKTFYYPLADGGTDPARVVKVAQPSDRLSAPLDLTGVRLLETRVLVHRNEGWVALPYVWNDDQTEATLQRTGDIQPLTLGDGDTETEFPYVVPNANQCAGCHATNNTTKVIEPIGPKARHLNLDLDLGDGPQPQLEAWQAQGLLTGLPDPTEIPAATNWDDDSASIVDRARAYLDINCAHCHNRVGPADTSGLFLESSTELGPRLGVCKSPVAAGTGTGGRLVGIHPGEPDESIFVYRMETSDPGAMMPELGRALTHDEGVELISTWIDSLAGDC